MKLVITRVHPERARITTAPPAAAAAAAAGTTPPSTPPRAAASALAMDQPALVSPLRLPSAMAAAAGKSPDVKVRDTARCN